MHIYNNFVHFGFIIFNLYNYIEISQAWENSDLEMFDLVEEVAKNFYDVLGVSQDASSKDIRQAYRRLSVKLHPDKNPDDPEAHTKFRQLVGIYEVLKDPHTREAYEDVLKNGLPNWRQPIFYYRRYRKLNLWQVALIVLVIVSIGQYLAGWASYWEKRISLKEHVEADRRRKQRTRKAQKEGKTQDEAMAEYDHLLPKPSIWNVAPFQIYRGIKYSIFGLPFDIIALIKLIYERQKAKEEEKRKAIEEAEEEKKRLELEEQNKKPRKRKVFEVPEKDEAEEKVATWGANESSESGTFQKQEKRPPVISGGLWTDEDLSELVKLCSKYPGGTTGRWETIAALLNRPVPEVTYMAKKVLERLASKATGDETEIQANFEISETSTTFVPAPLKVKVKTKGGGKVDALDRLKVENWSSEEQKALENALQSYGKGVSDRWDKIANAVPGRSKEECMQRFKYLADLVQQKKKKDEEEAAAAATASKETEASEVQADEAYLDEKASPAISNNQRKGNKLSKKAKRRQRELRRQSSSSSTDPTEESDWMLLEEDEEEE